MPGHDEPRDPWSKTMSDEPITFTSKGPQARRQHPGAGRRRARREAAGLHRAARLRLDAPCRQRQAALRACWRSSATSRLRFDMPGCGESEGPRGRLICLDQVQATSRRADVPRAASECRRRAHRACSARASAPRSRSIAAASTSASPRRSRRPAGAMASANSAASIRAPAAWTKFTDMLAEGKRASREAPASR